MRRFTTLLPLLGLVPFTLAFDDCDLTEADQAKIEGELTSEAYQKAMKMLEQFGGEVPSDPCDGSVLCHGPAPANETFECHDCVEICTGSRSDDGSWTGGAGCEPIELQETLAIEVNVSALSTDIVSASATTTIEAHLYTTALQKAALSKPVEPRSGKDPDTYVGMRGVYTVESSFTQEIAIAWPGPPGGSGGGSTTITIESEQSMGGIARCSFVDAGESCGDGPGGSSNCDPGGKDGGSCGLPVDPPGECVDGGPCTEGTGGVEEDPCAGLCGDECEGQCDTEGVVP